MCKWPWYVKWKEKRINSYSIHFLLTGDRQPNGRGFNQTNSESMAKTFWTTIKQGRHTVQHPYQNEEINQSRNKRSREQSREGDKSISNYRTGSRITVGLIKTDLGQYPNSSIFHWPYSGIPGNMGWSRSPLNCFQMLQKFRWFLYASFYLTVC